MAVTENKMIKDFVDAIKTGTKEKTKAYESPATVTRIENGVAWVHVPGGVEETPVQLTIAASEGDQVRVRVANGRATIVGNVTSPPTDDRTAREALYNANVANLSARSAEASASAAKQYAEVAKQTTDEINAYADTVGKTVTQVLEDGETAGAAAEQAKTSAETAWANLSQVQSVLEVAQWIATHGTYVKATTFNPNATYYTLTATQVATPSDDDKDSDGVLIYYELDNGIYVRTTDTSVQAGKTYYNAVGTPVSQPSAEHIADYYTLNVTDAMTDYIKSHLALTDEGLWIIKDGSGYKLKLTDYGSYIIAPDGTTVVNQNTADGNIIRALSGTVIAHLGYGEGSSGSGTATAPYYTFGRRPSTNALYDNTRTYSIGDICKYNNKEYVCVEEIAVPEEWTSSHWRLAIGNWSVAEGDLTIASGARSHAEGAATKALGLYSHTEGNSTVTIGSMAHAEGVGTKALGNFSHTEGSYTIASGIGSHAQNMRTIASRRSQTVIGEYNTEDTQGQNEQRRGKYAFIIGNGADENTRSNAFAVLWDGNVEMELDTTDPPDTTTTDGQIYQALKDLGWDSDVIV